MNTQREPDEIWASGFYLTEDLPKNFGKWSEKKLHKFLVDHAWQPFEYYEADDIWEHIERLADQGRTYFERNRTEKLDQVLKICKTNVNVDWVSGMSDTEVGEEFAAIVKIIEEKKI